MEIYAGTSLEAQFTKHFPTQVWGRIKSAQKQLKELSENFDWGKERLVKAGIEAPLNIVERLQVEGRYEPKLEKSQVLRRQQEMRESGLLQEDMKVVDLFEEDDQVVPLAGELIMEEDTTEDVLKQVEGELS